MIKSLRNNIGLKLLAFLSAFLLWLIVVNIDNPVSTKTYQNIPVIVENESVITADRKTYQIVDDTQTVSVTVSALRSELDKIKAEDIAATADMKELYLESQIPIEVTVKGHDYEAAVSNPRNLQVKIENNSSKTVPITPVTVGTVRDGYVLGTLKADPEKVTINGPESVIDKITKVTAEVDISGLAQDSSLESALTLYDSDNNVIDQSLLGNNLGNIGVLVEVTLLHTKSIPIRIDTSAVEPEEGYTIAGDIIFSPQEISIAGEEALLQQITAIDIPASALAGKPISKRTEKTIDIAPFLPEGVQLVDETGNNLIVTISVERDGTKSFDLPVGSIAVKNLDEDFKLSYGGTEDLEIQVRGPQETLDAFDVERAASVDLGSLTAAGTYKVVVDIALPVGCTLEETVQIEVILEEK